MSWAVPQHFSMIQKARREAEQRYPHLPVHPAPGIYRTDAYKPWGTAVALKPLHSKGCCAPALCCAQPSPLFVILKQKQNGQGLLWFPSTIWQFSTETAVMQYSESCT